MKFEDYNDFYTKVIKKYIDELKDYDSKYHALEQDAKAEVRIYRFYEKKRIEVRTEYMMDASKPIDRHKTAACMMYAILRAKVFKINYRIPNLPEPLRIANEYLAFYVALNIVDQYKRQDDLKNRDIKDSNYRLILPETMYEASLNSESGQNRHSLVSSMCLTLANIRNIKYYDLFAYSTIFFLLEAYSDCLLGRESNGQ